MLKEVSSEAGSDLLQEDLEALYRWADHNNMSFNSTKFEHLRYSAVHDNSAAYMYKAHEGSDIETKENLRDLGITLSCDGTFTTHINTVTKTARSQAGWILRTFQTRDTLPMLTLYKSLVIPLLEYYCQAVEPVEGWRETAA